MPSARSLGLEPVSVTSERIEARLTVTEALCTTGRIMHGGAIVVAEATPVHVGRRTSVWQTRLTNDGKLVALVTQTQMVLT